METRFLIPVNTDGGKGAYLLNLKRKINITQMITKKNIRENIVIKGFVEKCPKCPYLMARKTRLEILPYMLKQRGYFTEWDYCDRCKHVQHYQKYRIENPR